MTDVADAETADADPFQRALAEHMAGNFLHAKQQYRAILKSDPNHFDTHQMLGVLLAQNGDPKEGITHLLRALELDSKSPAAYNNYGNVLRLLERSDEALAAYEKALQIDPDYREAGANFGGLLYELSRYEEAIAFWSKEILICQDSGLAHNSLAMSLIEVGRYEEALIHCEMAISLMPDFFPAYGNAAVALVMLNQYDEAIARCEEALSINPDYPEAHHNAAIAFEKSNLSEKALASYAAAHSLVPNDLQILFNQSLLHLRLGNYTQGFKDHELRWEIKKLREKIPMIDSPRPASLEAVRGKRILLCGEQGIGDVLQFIRYAQPLTKIAAEVHAVMPRSVVSLFGDALSLSSVSAYGEILPAVDYFTSLMSLPHLFGTTLQTIPAKVPYILADPQKISEWKRRIGSHEKITVGLAWSGNPKHVNDRNRSIALSALQPIISLPGFTFISLQQEMRPEDAVVAARADKLLQFGEHLKDFSDTAALAACVDLIISVDTSVAHLAGAMALPLWVLLPFSPDWRWLENRDDSPWYPTAKLFRQGKVGDWGGVIDRVVNDLLRFQRKKSWIRRIFST
ncbi:MAG: tetratricopeptide repeat protein [Nevskiaceae bacterium]|nr:MAG: tetratricopeptide repeat protein [Nevskiaceae bacterium]